MALTPKELSLKPQDFGRTFQWNTAIKDAWYYEDNGGISVYISVQKPLVENDTVWLTIPWRKVRASLKRKDASLKSKKRKKR